MLWKTTCGLAGAKRGASSIGLTVIETRAGLLVKFAGAPAWAAWACLALGALQIVTDVLFSMKSSDWKKVRRELHVARRQHAGRLAGDIGSRKAPSGIEVALYRPATNAPSSFVKIDVPINAHHGTSTGRHEVENLAGAHAKQNGGHSKVGDSFEDALGRR